MNIESFPDYSTMSAYGASLVMEEVRKKPTLLLCTATGNSPSGVYEGLLLQAEKKKALFSHIRIVKLDEWVGLGKNAEGTCEQYLRAKLIKPLEISKDRYLSFDADAEDPEEDCRRIQFELQKNGAIDLCVLGLGANGHIGFNEPGLHLQPNCHVAQLAPKSQEHAMIAGGEVRPNYGMTLGMSDILLSKKIILLVSGKGKEDAKQELLSGRITTKCPASFLWLHGNADCLLVVS